MIFCCSDLVLFCRINPTVLGTKPKSCKGHSAVLLSGDRILIIKSGSNSDDFAWFLEVGTFKTIEMIWEYRTA